MTETIIEAVARALLDLDETGEGIVHIITWENASARQRKYYIEAAEIALAVATPLILERAAKVAEDFPYFVTREKIATAIRALQKKP